MTAKVSYAQRVIMIWFIIGGQFESIYVDCSELECDFSISVNISKATHSNKDIIFYGVRFPHGHYTEDNKIVLLNGTKIDVQPYAKVCCSGYQCDKFCHENEIELTFGLKVKCILKIILDISEFNGWWFYQSSRIKYFQLFFS